MSVPRTRAPRVLVTNDDGPPTVASGGSPFVYPFARALAKELRWDVRVVVPSGQRSWVGKSYAIAQTTTGQYFYPTGEDGVQGEKCDLPRPLKEGEEVEWILLDGTPATCSNIALHSLFPPNSFDLVVSGPNFGRNTSTAFALSSGTIGAAMSASLSGVPAIALSWGLMTGHKPPTQAILDGAVKSSCAVVKKLWETGWGEGASKVDVFSINVPLMPSILHPDGPEVQWTRMATTSYQRLFKSISGTPATTATKDAGGPAAIPQSEDGMATVESTEDVLSLQEEHFSAPLKFVFAPEIGALVNPTPSTLKNGTDTHALIGGSISVTPIRAAFAAADFPSGIATDGLKWRL